MTKRADVHRDARPARGGRVSRSAALVLVAVVASLVTGSAALAAATAAKAPPSQPTVLWGISPSGPDPTVPGTRTSFSYSLAKGGTVTDRATIWNEGSQPLPLRLYTTDALDTAEGQFGLIPANERPTGVGTWVTLVERNVIVPPHSGHVTSFTVTVPPHASPGDHAGALVAVLSTPVSEPSGHQVLVEQQVASKMYVRVAGHLVPKLSVTVQSHYHHQLSALGGGSLDVSYIVRNTGNIRLAAHQKVTVSAPFGLTLKTTHLSDLPELLPGGSATKVVHIHDVLPLFRLTTTVHLAPFSTAGGVQPKAPPASGSSSVWAIPWLWLLIAAAVAAYIWWRRRRNAPAEPLRAASTSAPDDRPPVPASADLGASE